MPAPSIVDHKLQPAQSASSFTQAMTVSGSNTALLVFVINESNIQDTPTFNGSNLSFITSFYYSQSVFQETVYVWQMVSPIAGSHNLVVPISGGFGSYVAMTFQDVNQSTPFTNFNALNSFTLGTLTSVSLAITSATNNLVVDYVTITRIAQGAPSCGGSQTPVDSVEGSFTYDASSSQPGAATTTMSWSWTGNGAIASQCGISVNPVASAPSFIPTPSSSSSQGVSSGSMTPYAVGT